jgi:hypothetical protein
MFEKLQICLCFEATDQAEIQIALEYWAFDRESGWQLTVKQIADRVGERKHRIADRVRSAATAFNLDVRCELCGAPLPVSSRSDVQVSRYMATYVCEACRHARAEAERLKQQEQNESERKRLASVLNVLTADVSPFEYSELDYFDAVVAYAIMMHSDSAIVNGTIEDPYQLALCPSDSLFSKLLARLFDDGVLKFAKKTDVNALSGDTEGPERISYFPLKVSWQFAVPLKGSGFSILFRQIGAFIDEKEQHPGYREAVRRLWWMLAEADAEQYLRRELETYRLSGFVVGQKMREALQYGLSRFSIPKLRTLLWRVAKNAAALSARRDYTRQHALNTIPGNLIRDCDRAIADQWDIKGYCMKWDDEEAPLITLLFDRVLGTGIAGFRSTSGSVLECDLSQEPDHFHPSSHSVQGGA